MDPNDPNAGGVEPMGMPVFNLSPNELGVHGPGYYTVMIEGPIDNPTGISLMEVAFDNGMYEVGGDPIAGDIACWRRQTKC